MDAESTWADPMLVLQKIVPQRHGSFLPRIIATRSGMGKRLIHQQSSLSHQLRPQPAILAGGDALQHTRLGCVPGVLGGHLCYINPAAAGSGYRRTITSQPSTAFFSCTLYE